MSMNETTQRLEGLMARHADRIEEAVATYGLPLHVLFKEQIGETVAGFLEVARRNYPKTLVSFAAKSNPCRGAIRTAHTLGLGLDAASEFEFRAGLEEGIPPQQITCNGNAKSDAYITEAIQADAMIAVDNADELDRIEVLAAELGASPTLLIRFRGMPLAGLTSDDQTTASDWTKFGFHVDEAPVLFERLRACEHVTFGGISAHIGTQIADAAGYRRLLEHFFDLADLARSMEMPVSYIDIGGGFPERFLGEADWSRFTAQLRDRLRGEVGISEAVTWNDEPMGYARARRGVRADEPWVGKAFWTPNPTSAMLEKLLTFEFADGQSTVDRLISLGSPALIVEPGRSLMAGAGVTLTKVMGVKDVLGHHVVALDMGINNHGTNLISLDLFPASVLPARDSDEPVSAFLAGRLCFSGDMVSKAKVRLNRLPVRGDDFVLYKTGAYGADHFASHSCGFPRPGKVAIREDGSLEVWRAPESFSDVFGSADDPLLEGN